MDMVIPKGFCQCGCGQATATTKRAYLNKGYLKGEPFRYLRGHSLRGRGKKNGRIKTDSGYIKLLKAKDPGIRSSYEGEHVRVAIKALGKPLPHGAIVHHIDEDTTNNANNNLLICTQSYHNLLHGRIRALKACGNANWKRCPYCKTYDNPEQMYKSPKHNTFQHRACRNAYRRQQTRRSHN